MGDTGFFTRTDSASALDKKRDPRAVTDETLWKLGLRGVKRMNPRARSPVMEPAGEDRPEIYILGEQPSERDDNEGEHFTGEDGIALMEGLGQHTYYEARLNNVVCTRVAKAGFPDRTEIECFRPSLILDIEQSQPAVIVTLGIVAARWALSGLSKKVKMTSLRGRVFQAKIGSHECLVVPALAPAMLRSWGDKRYEGIDASEHWKAFYRDLKLAKKVAQDPPEWGRVEVTKTNVTEGIVCCYTFKECKSAIKRAAKLDRLALDIETKGLRPYPIGNKILSIAFGDDRNVWAIPWDHPESKLTRAEKLDLSERLYGLFTEHEEVIAHNLAFELEWLAYEMGKRLLRSHVWRDTMAQAWVLDERKGCHNLDFCCLYRLGSGIKAFGEINVTELDSTPLPKVLRYNGIDVKYTYMLYDRQEQLIADQGLQSIAARHHRRIPTAVALQLQGVDIDQDEVQEQIETVEEQIAEIESACKKTSEVKRYEREQSTFSPSSNAAVLVIMKDYIGTSAIEKGDKYTTDAAALAQVDHPLAELIVQYRELAKLKSTYLEKFLISHPDTLVYPDGKIHCQFNTLFTDSGRWSSDGPNNQNWPKRKNKQVRKIVRPKKI
tara:strand:+ start:8453 stop:10276 length:1824 start_codon:yes stop_codon:yes gene_type:complete